MDPELLQAIGRVTVTAAHIETALLRALRPLTGMPLGGVIAFVGNMHAEPLISTIERMIEWNNGRDQVAVQAHWKPLKRDLTAFLGFRGRLAHTSWVFVRGPEGPLDEPGVMRPWRREPNFFEVKDLPVEEILSWYTKGEELLGRLQQFSEYLEATPGDTSAPVA